MTVATRGVAADIGQAELRRPARCFTAEVPVPFAAALDLVESAALIAEAGLQRERRTANFMQALKGYIENPLRLLSA